jgi:GT2 family glycosyltransferase
LEKNNPLVSIIVLNYNAGKLLHNCIESLQKLDYDNIEIIVVDNISTDNSQNECKEKFSNIKLIQNNENIGYCGGNNVGIKQAKGEFILVLNPDTIVESNLISEILTAYRKNGDGLYQPKILSLDNKEILQSTGNMIHIFGFGFARDKGKSDNTKSNEIDSIGYASGTCLFSSRKIFEKLGFFDEFLFLYHDDLDLGWRAKQRGIKSYFVPNTAIYHAESYSLKWSKKKFYWLERNRKYCLKTHYSKETLKKIKSSLWYTEILVWLFYLSKGYVSAKIQAESDLRKNYEFIKKKQIEIENQKTISDLELIKEFPDRIEVPKDVSEGFHSKIFLNMIEYLSKKAKNKLINN